MKEKFKNEIWKDIIEYEGLYQISNYGRVKSLQRIIYKVDGRIQTFKERILKPATDKNGYQQIGLHKNCKQKTIQIHREVAIAFIPNPENKPEVNHCDGIKNNNNDWNLEWNTSSENNQHAYNTGLKIGNKGEKHGMCKLTNLQVIEIRNLKDKLIQQKIADKYGVNQQQISKIINHKLWTHLL
jgi:hypothetical protein